MTDNRWWNQKHKTRADELREYTMAQEAYYKKMNMPPEISGDTLKQVSAQRREVLEQELSSGYFREQGSQPKFVSGKYFFDSNNFVPEGFSDLGNNQPDFTKETQAGVVSISSSAISKTANLGSGPIGTGGVVGNSWRGSNDAVRQVPEVYSPLWLNSNLNLPKDRNTVNAWSRSFFALNPIVHNAISLHSTYPISKLNIKSKNKRVEQFFSDMIEEIDLLNVCISIAQEFWTLGEAFVYAELDEEKGKWKQLLIQNPDYIAVERSVNGGAPIISLRPDPNLKKIVTGNRPEDIRQRQQLSQDVIDRVRKGQNIPLDNFNIHHLARRIAPYEVRGTGLIVNCFRSLMLFDKLKESKYTQADCMVNPTTLVKIGNKDFRPTPVDLEHWRNVFEAASYDKNARIFSHDAVTVERVGYGQGIYDIQNDIQQCIKEIYIGLMVPSVLMDGTDTTYANGSVALDVLRQRYMAFRNMLSSWLKNKIFAPISRINGFYEYEEGEKTLIVPNIDWNHMSLFDMNDYIQNVLNLAQGSGQPGTSKVSLQTVYRSLGLEYEDEKRKMRYEDIDEIIRQKELEALQRYDLSSLRALGPHDEITEPVDSPVPGQTSFVDPPSADDGMPGGMPGGLGGPPGGMPGGGPKPPGGGPRPIGGRPRPPMGAGGAPPKGPGGVPKPPGAPSDSGGGSGAPPPPV